MGTSLYSGADACPTEKIYQINY